MTAPPNPRAGEATAGLDDSGRERVQQAVTVMNAVYGAPGRLRELAADLVAHWETRSGQMRKFIGIPGKGLIVCATRDICARLHEEITALRPGWHSDDVHKGRSPGRAEPTSILTSFTATLCRWAAPPPRTNERAADWSGQAVRSGHDGT